jgi:hypothetical protein
MRSNTPSPRARREADEETLPHGRGSIDDCLDRAPAARDETMGRLRLAVKRAMVPKGNMLFYGLLTFLTRQVDIVSISIVASAVFSHRLKVSAARWQSVFHT